MNDIKNSDKKYYYIEDVDTDNKSIYCHHDLMGELHIPVHKHKKAQMLYTEGGIVYVNTETKNYFLPARHFIWIPAGISHSIEASSPKVIMRNLYFPEEPEDLPFYLTEGIYPVNDLLLQLMLFTNKWNGNLKNGCRNYTIANAIKAILPEICGINLHLSLPSPKDKRLINIINFIEHNLGENLLLSDIAINFGLSEKSLYRLFRKDLRMSFIQYFTIRRILRAIELMLDKKYSVKEASLIVGYQSTPTFSNTFYKILGQRPSDYLSGKEILNIKKQL